VGQLCYYKLGVHGPRSFHARLLERYQNWEDIDNVTDAKF